MFQDPDEFVEPNYVTVGSTTMNGGFQIELHGCSLCGSVVLDRVGHSEWHAQLWVVFKRER